MAGGQCSGQSPQARLCEGVLNISIHGLLLVLSNVIDIPRIYAYFIGEKAKSRHEEISCVYELDELMMLNFYSGNKVKANRSRRCKLCPEKVKRNATSAPEPSNFRSICTENDTISLDMR